MDFVKFYIVQLLKSSTSRLRLTDRDKERILSRLTYRLENSADIFPEIKTMERVKGLEETALRMLTIYRRLNKARIDLERISYQFGDDRDALTSALRRFLQGKQTASLNIDKSSRPKIVFDDSTFTFYEIKDTPHKKVELQPKEKISEEDKLELNEFLERDVESLVEVNDNVEIINVSTPPVEESDIDEVTEESNVKSPFDLITKEENQDTYEVMTQTDLDNVPTESSIDESAKGNLELSLFDEEVTDKEIASQMITKSEDNSEIESFSDETEQEIETKSEPTTQKEFILREELSDRDGTFHRKGKKNTEERPKTEEEIFYEFETDLVNNIKELDDYLGKITLSSYDEKKEEELITQAYKSLLTAEALGHEVIAKMIKTYWAALLAIRDKKLPSTKNEAELIRSTLIIIVALVKDKDIELESYWDNHNYLVKKLKDLSYEV